MKVRELLNDANDEIVSELRDTRKRQLKERLREITAAERVAAKLRAGLEKFLDSDVEDAVFTD